MRESSEAFVALQYQGFLGRVELPGKRRHGGSRGFAALEELGEAKVVEVYFNKRSAARRFAQRMWKTAGIFRGPVHFVD